jgi:hypothetical protein
MKHPVTRDRAASKGSHGACDPELERRTSAGFLSALRRAGWGMFAAAVCAVAEPVFHHAGFDQLSRGELGNAGQNLFVSRNGELKLINWFDLDRDGHPEIVINNEHNPNESVDGLIYFQHPTEGFRSLLPITAGDGGEFDRLLALRSAPSHTQFLPALGAGHSVIADLNGDGFADIAFVNFIHGSTHDHLPVFVYWGAAAGFSSERRSEFPTTTAAGLTAADLDGDGRLELVIANLGSEDAVVAAVNGPRRIAPAPPNSTSRIYWNAVNGFSVDRITDLPTRFAIDVKADDLDRDGHLDLVFLEGGDAPALRVFYGDARGFSAERTEQVAVEGRGFIEEQAGEVNLADLDADGRPDIVVTAGGDAAQVLWNHFGSGRGNLRDWPRTTLPANSPMSSAVGDFNADGLLDVAVGGFSAPGDHRKVYETETRIYWGAATRSLLTGPPTALPVLGNTTLRAADLNGDGWLDLACANSRDSATFDVPSYVYWGGPGGFSAARRAELTGFGPASLAIGDLNRDGRPDLYLANRDSGLTKDAAALNSYVYWGNPQRSFSSAVLTKVPLLGGYSCTAADFFDEGRGAVAYVDEEGVLLVRFDARRRIAGRVRVELPFQGMTSTVADFNRDGRLDLIVGSIAGGGSLALLRGTEGGFAAPQLLQPGMQVLASAVADLGGTGKLELILGGRGGWLRCPLLSDGTPDLAHATRISGDFQVQHVSVADLNNDGFPEVVAAQYRIMSTRRNAIDSAIYWNRAGQFAFDDRTPLGTFGAHWVSVADTENKGRLDALFSNYHGETTRVVPLFVYPPDDQGVFRSDRRRTFPAYSSSSHVVADIDGDHFNDIVVINHTGPVADLGLSPKSGRHNVGSFIYWGAKDGFDESRRTWIASYGPHATINAEVGDVLRRRPFEAYTSAWERVRLDAGEYRLTVSGTFTGRAGCRAFLQLRENATAWVPLESGDRTGNAITFRVPLSDATTTVRYRLELDTGGAGTGPTVKSIELGRF